jgi:hypothetical protein
VASPDACHALTAGCRRSIVRVFFGLVLLHHSFTVISPSRACGRSLHTGGSPRPHIHDLTHARPLFTDHVDSTPSGTRSAQATARTHC